MTKQARTLTERELQKLLEFISKTKSAKRNRAIILLTHFAGLRIGECSALLIGDVVASDGAIRTEFTLSAGQTKGSSSRTVLLNKRIQAELAAYVQSLRVRDPKKPLFSTQRSVGFTANTLTHVVNGIYKKAGLDGCSSHSGRRNYLSALSAQGVSVRVMMALAGHKNMSTTQRYIDYSPSVLRNAVELV